MFFLRPAQAGALSSAEIAEALDLGSELFTVCSCAVELKKLCVY